MSHLARTIRVIVAGLITLTGVFCVPHLSGSALAAGGSRAEADQLRLQRLLSSIRQQKDATRHKRNTDQWGVCIKGDCINGEGTFEYHNKDRYEGQWRNGKRHGQGTIHHAKGHETTATWRDGKRVGVARKHLNFASYMAARDRQRAEKKVQRAKERELAQQGAGNSDFLSAKLLAGAIGCVEGNCTNGVGTYTYEERDFYTGEWQNGQRHGFGKYQFRSGDWYSGNWKLNKKHGQGTYYFADSGKKIIANWQMGKKLGRGVIVSPDGTKRIVRW